MFEKSRLRGAECGSFDLKRLKQSLELKAGIERSPSAEANGRPQMKIAGRDEAIMSTGASARPATFATGKPISRAESFLNRQWHQLFKR